MKNNEKITITTVTTSTVDNQKIILPKENCFLINKVISSEDPYDTIDQFMVEELFFEPSY